MKRSIFQRSTSNSGRTLVLKNKPSGKGLLSIKDNRNSNLFSKTIQGKAVNPTGGSATTDAAVWLSRSTTLSTGHVFEVDMGTKSTKADLLKSVAEKGKNVGQNSDVDSNNWVTSASDYNNPLETKIDPFRMRAKGKYGTTSTVDYSQDYHYGPFNLGYVVSVTDQGSSATMDPSYSPGSGNGVAPKYSNQHQHTGSASILTDASYTQSTSGTLADSEKGWDANTKLTGEGARWDCVKDNMSALTDDTYFYTDDTTTTSITNPGIKFSDLWLTWSAEFGKKFGIPDSTVKTKLKSQTTFSKINGNVSIEDASSKSQKIKIT